uniref:Uncharacterized protein LOC111133106 n=1 Tax=Crassostrea virginica TaxID=6565 RepID=A0A8B8E8E4_CRAVI|nr:uncharacterized protein LOC111133106 [Crassostrea virginica]
MLSIPLNNRLIEKIESRSAISAVSLKKKKPKKDVVKINSKVLEKVESESENGEDEEMDEEPSTGSDETAVCDVEADEMMNHTIPAPVHVAVPFMISTAMANMYVTVNVVKRITMKKSVVVFLCFTRERIRLFSRSKENNSRQIL